MSPEHQSRPFGADLHHIGLVVDLLRLSANEAVEEIASLLHPQMRVLAAPGLAPSRAYETREDFIDYFSEAQSQGVLIQPDAHEIRTGGPSVIVAGHVRITTADSIDETPAWFVYTFRDDLIDSLSTFLDAELAEEAVLERSG